MNAKTCRERKAELVETTCPYCGVGCGVDAEVKYDQNNDNARLCSIKGTNSHPANFGKLCVKGTNLAKSNGLEGRMLTPRIAGVDCDWPTAITHVANVFKQTIAQYGPDSVAFYVSGQLLTEDYYVANKLMKGYIGSANIDTNSRLCMSSAVAAYKRAFGADAVPCSYDDLDCSELLVLVGSNAAWTHPVLFQRMERAKKRNPNTKIVIIDPRKTASCELADFHLQLSPGSDVALFNGLLAWLNDNNCIDAEFINSYTNGFKSTVEIANQLSIEAVSELCDIDIKQLEQFFALYAKSDSAITFYSMGVNQSSSGVDKANAIINCHLATAKIGKPGSGPFSITGQPNAMGGREVGGLANMLAAHMDIDNPQHRELVQEFWQSPKIPERNGCRAVDLFDQIDTGQIKAVWIMATNPLVSMPNRSKVEAALKNCEHVIVSDCVNDNDTIQLADVCLPATGWSEKNGTVTNSERRISRQRGILSPAGAAKNDWQIICEVAQQMGYTKGFEYTHPAQIFDEHTRLSAFRNNQDDIFRDFNLSALTQLSESEYNSLKPVQWPVTTKDKIGTKRLFTDNLFYTATKKANFIAISHKTPQSTVSTEFPFVLNSGRSRDQWHTMTRTGMSHELMTHTPIATLSINPKDALALDVTEGQLVSICSSHSQKNQVILPVKVSNEVRTGEVFAPIHWSDTWGSSCSIARLYGDARDDISGQPELKYTAVSIKKKQVFSYSTVLTANSIEPALLTKMEYWTKQTSAFGFIYHFAQFNQNNNIDNLIEMLPAVDVWVSKHGSLCNSGIGYKQDKLNAFYMSQSQGFSINSDWARSLFLADKLSLVDVNMLLRNLVPDTFASGKLVCSCYKVHESTIIEAVCDGVDSVEGLADQLKCGTNCGSCKSELRQYVRDYKPIKPEQKIEVEQIEC